MITSSAKNRVPPAIRRAVLAIPRFIDQAGNEPPPNRDTIAKGKLYKTIPIIPRPSRWTKNEIDVLNEAVNYASLLRVQAQLRRSFPGTLRDMQLSDITGARLPNSDQSAPSFAFRPYFDSDDEDDAPLFALARSQLNPSVSSDPMTPSSSSSASDDRRVNIAWFALRLGVFPHSFTSALNPDDLATTMPSPRPSQGQGSADVPGTTTGAGVAGIVLRGPPQADVARVAAIVDRFLAHKSAARASSTAPTDQRMQVGRTASDQGESKEELETPTWGSVMADATRINWAYIADKWVRTKSGMDCYLRWNAVQNPAIRTAPWSQAELTKLKEAIARHRARNWVAIAQEVGSGRTPLDCLRLYQQKLSLVHVQNGPFTLAEDAELATLVAQFGDADWNRISMEMSTFRMPKQLEARWHKSGNSLLRRGRWSAEEDARLLLAIRAYTVVTEKKKDGDPDNAQQSEFNEHVSDDEEVDDDMPLSLRRKPMKSSSSSSSSQTGSEVKSLEDIVNEGGHVRILWARVQQHLPGRTDLQCRERYMNLVARAKTGRWTPEATAALHEAVSTHGAGQWQMIAFQLHSAGYGDFDWRACKRKWLSTADENLVRDYKEKSKEQDV